MTARRIKQRHPGARVVFVDHHAAEAGERNVHDAAAAE